MTDDLRQYLDASPETVAGAERAEVEVERLRYGPTSIYVVMVPGDPTEDRLPWRPAAYALTEAAARDYAKGRGVWGEDAQVQRVDLLDAQPSAGRQTAASALLGAGRRYLRPGESMLDELIDERGGESAALRAQVDDLTRERDALRRHYEGLLQRAADARWEANSDAVHAERWAVAAMKRCAWLDRKVARWRRRVERADAVVCEAESDRESRRRQIERLVRRLDDANRERDEARAEGVLARAEGVRWSDLAHAAEAQVDRAVNAAYALLRRAKHAEAEVAAVWDALGVPPDLRTADLAASVRAALDRVSGAEAHRRALEAIAGPVEGVET